MKKAITSIRQINVKPTLSNQFTTLVGSDYDRNSNYKKTVTNAREQPTQHMIPDPTTMSEFGLNVGLAQARNHESFCHSIKTGPSNKSVIDEFVHMRSNQPKGTKNYVMDTASINSFKSFADEFIKGDERVTKHNG